MVRPSIRWRIALALVPFVGACGSSIKNAAPGSANAPTAVQVAPRYREPAATAPIGRPEDPVLTLIATSESSFAAGERELAVGHPDAARHQFDKAINVLLESSYGGRTEPRIRDHFDRLVDRISALEIKALADGDGFTEKKYDPASIDELLAVSATFGEPEPIPAAKLKQAVESDIKATNHDLPIPLNQRVLAYIDLFQGRLHDFIEEGLRRGSKYLPMIQNVFRAEGLPLDLAYVPLVESAFKPNALSRANAKGVWQFMRGTGIENGLRQDWYIDERSDPEKATVAAAKYLGTLAKLFNEDWHLVLASYNGGPGRIQRALKMGKAEDFWQLASKPRLLPRETREYVPMILAAVVIARNPAQYGFEFEPDAPRDYETVMLPKPVDLRRIAEWTASSIDDIQSLNPELRRWTTPVSDTAYELRVPLGTAETVSTRLTDSDANDLASLNWYTVKKGETLLSIARKLKVGRADLAEANFVKPTAKVTAGQKLMVPHESTVLMAARTDRGVPPADSRTLVADTVVPAVDGIEPERIKVIYEVRKGDTLASIARVFQTTVAALKTWNRIPGTAIRTGERLTIYTVRGN